MEEKRKFKGGLKRLPPEAYQGHTWVHWSMTMDQRRTGWLSPLMHSRIREALLHSLTRHHLICGVYCLMPDHSHFLIGGLRPEPASDQRLAMALFRKEWNRQLAQINPHFKLQKQAYDHVLTKREQTDRVLFQKQINYILDNPTNHTLVQSIKEWEYYGALIPGYPDFHPLTDRFPEIFWNIFDELRQDCSLNR